MILTCPSCDAQYLIQEAQIPPEGRKVKCSSCAYTWHQPPISEVNKEAEQEIIPPEVAYESVSEPDTPAPEEESPVVASSEDADDGGDAQAAQQALEEALGYSGDEENEGDKQTNETDETAEVIEDGDDSFDKPDNFPSFADDSEDFSSIRDDINEIYHGGLNDELYGDFSPVKAVGSFVSAAFLALILMFGVLFGIRHYVGQPMHPVIDSVYRHALNQLNSRANPVTGQGLAFDQVTIEEMEDGRVALTGRLDNVSGRSKKVPPIVIEAVNSSGSVIKTWALPFNRERLTVGGSAILSHEISDMPMDAESLRLTFVSS